MRAAAVAAIALLSASSALASISFCGSEAGRCLHAAVSHCDSEAPHCVLRRGSSAAITIAFSPDHKVAVVKPRVFGVLHGLSIPFPLTQTNACGTCGFECPLAPGHHYNYSDAVAVRRIYPPVAVTVLWKLLDENEKVICCVKIPSVIR